MEASEEDSLLRILISTDNHLGVWEKDEVRKHDSFRAFEEVLQLAVEKDVDLLLLGGDLFHDNKPSRSTVIRCIELLRKYCLGDRPVALEVLSDQSANFEAKVANFQDPDINVGLPVLTIHGNHDDPAGQDNLSAVDLLSSCRLVNYFGKVLLSGNNMGNITLAPVLLRKGNTKLALYGLGNVRDERLGRLFQAPGCVHWMRPAATPELPLEEWLNVFVLHQNRVQHGARAKNCLQEHHLPPFMDLVVWGHEHECIPEPQALHGSKGEKEARDQFVLQPGSSVATALSEGEAKPKHVILLEMLHQSWRTIKLPLATVRPFVWDQVALASAQPPIDPDDAAAITTHLERKVAGMIQLALRDAPLLQQQQQQRHRHRQQQQQQPPAGEPLLPLIRLRVDYTGFTTVNSQRFGQKFVGKVANPHDMLLWAKAPARRAKGGGEGGRGGAAGGEEEEEEEAAGALGLSGLRAGGQLEQARIEDLVRANLQANLDILPPEELALALHEFVEKDERGALATCVTAVLQETQAAAMARRPGDADADAGGEAGAGERRLALATPRAGGKQEEDEAAAAVNESVHRRKVAKQQQLAQGGATPGVGISSGRASPAANGGWGEDGLEADGAAGAARGAAAGMPPPAPRGRQKKAAAGGRQASLAEAFARNASQQTQQQQQQLLQLPPPVSPVGKTGSTLDGFLAAASGGGGGTPSQNTSRSRTAAAGGGRGRGRGRARGRGARGAAAGKRGRAASEDEGEEEEGASDLLSSDDAISSDGEPLGAPRPAKRGRAAATPPRPRRAAAAAAARKPAAPAHDEEDDLLDSDDDGAALAPSRSRAAAAGGGAAGRPRGARARPGSQQRSLAAAASSFGGDDEEEEGISDDPSEEHEPIEDDDHDHAARGTRQRGGARAPAASGRRGGASQGHHRGSVLADSGDDEPPPPPTASRQAGGGGRRRLLPASLGGGPSQK